MTIHHAQYLPCGASMTHLASSGRDVHAQHDVVCTKFQMGKSTMSTGEIGTGEIGDQWSVPAYFTSRLQQPTQLSLFPTAPTPPSVPKAQTERRGCLDTNGSAPTSRNHKAFQQSRVVALRTKGPSPM